MLKITEITEITALPPKMHYNSISNWLNKLEASSSNITHMHCELYANNVMALAVNFDEISAEIKQNLLQNFSYCNHIAILI